MAVWNEGLGTPGKGDPREISDLAGDPQEVWEFPGVTPGKNTHWCGVNIIAAGVTG